MVGSMFFLLLFCSFETMTARGSRFSYKEIYLEHKLDASPQIHYEHCDRKYNCLIPSKYFNRPNETSLYITEETKTQFKDGIEINAISSSEWHLTLMANNSDSAVEFIWHNITFMRCDNNTKADQVIYSTNDSTVTALHDRYLSFSDPTKGGNSSDAMICKFSLQKRNMSEDRTMAVIFAALVQNTKDLQMCLKISGAVSEVYCNFIRDLVPHMRLSFNPLMCTKCKIDENTICRGGTLKECMDSGKFPQGLVRVDTREGTGCEFLFTPHKMLVNNQFYVEPGTEILCHQDRWMMLRYNPILSWDNPYESKEHYIETITHIQDHEDFLCEYSSPLKSLCKQGTDCRKISEWKAIIECGDDAYVLTYYRKGIAEKIKLDKAECNSQGIWIGTPIEHRENPTILTYTLRVGDNLICESLEDAPLEDDDFDLDSGTEIRTELLRRDDAEDFTSAIVLGTVVAVLFVILVIIIIIVVASCVGPWTGRPAGMKKSEKSQRPIRAAGEEEMSFSDRASLLFT